MRQVHLSRSFGFEAAPAVTSTFGILAKRGAGKSNVAAVMAEEMFDAGEQIVVVDPVGAWWGLRAGADGKPAGGLDVPILGGYHGDIPLEPGAGDLIADLIVDERLSAVLDVSAFDSETLKRRFLATFAERLFRAKGKPGKDDPLHLFLEEADDYAPQRATGEVARCLGAFQRIVKQGRARGLGATMVTQRSAVLNKDLLTQIETLIVLRTTSPNDRKAVAGWVEYHDADDEIIASLSTLAIGEAWVWSPAFLDVVEKVKVRRRRTFDSGATPTGGRHKAPATLADVDLGALQVRMAETIERQKAEDPAELRKRIRDLELEVRKEQAARDILERKMPETERVEVPVLTEGDRAMLEEVREGLWTLAESFGKFEGRFVGLLDAPEPPRDPEPIRPPRGHGLTAKRLPEPATIVERVLPVSREAVLDEVRPSGDVTIGKGERAVLSVLREWPNGKTPAEVAFLAGYSAKASTMRGILANLRKLDLVTPTPPVKLTSAGIEAAGGLLEMPRGSALLDRWMQHPRMGRGERAVLAEFVRVYPMVPSREELAAWTGYSHEASTLRGILAALRKLGLVEKNALRLSSEFAEAIR